MEQATHVDVTTAADGRQGLILHLQRLSTEDGPGLRTTVFFKGCPLRCAWCHNPESISSAGQLQWLENRCIGCDTCLQTCPHHALSRSAAGLVIDRVCCQACGKCAEACPANALELLGRRVGVEELVAELAKDRAFFVQSGGGVTLSGGEPTLQAGFAARLLEALQEQGIPTAVDTCGLCATQTLERLVALSDVVLYDVKLVDPARHAHFTGRPNRVILDNLRWLGDHLRTRAPATVLWVRTPLIPGATATAENVAAVGAFLTAHVGDVLQRWELCTFNNLCRDKYRRLGMDWAYAATPLLARAELDELERIAKGAGLAPEAVAVTGASRVE
jgi:pyruvate formate lyase activating enzyme